MIYEKEYVKSLVRKKVDGSICDHELEELETAYTVYTEEELSKMQAEIYIEMQDLIKEKYSNGDDDWTPDFEAIRNKEVEKNKGDWNCLSANKSPLSIG